ncbi:MAG TPA: hypothetical protein VG405_03235 [Solirubrobacteraceae bacterium]|nr:hypothetical protein [Solirubrobacteraceae bacterium]
MFSEAGSTRESTWGDPTGDGQLQVGPGEPLIPREDLAARTELGRVLVTVGHLTDAHVMDASSPARVTFLARLGPPFQSTFRPQEALTAQVLAGAVAAVRALGPDVVVQGGDLIDNDQQNELDQAVAALRGGQVKPGSGPDGYHGVQLESDPDPFYYRPDVDAPRHPGLLREAVRAFRSPGLGRPWLPVLGDHDILVAGELVPNPLTEHLAVGDRALWTLPEGLSLPPGLKAEAVNSPDGPPLAGLADQFLLQALQGPTVKVPADPQRHELSVGEAVGGLRSATSPSFGSEDRLDYVYDLGDRLRLIVLDLASREGGSGGRVVPGQVEFVRSALTEAADRWVVFASHQTLRQSVGGDQLQTVLDASPRVILLLNGHTHQNRIRVRHTPVGGHWELETASLIDWPQQARALRIHETHDGAGVAIETWMLDHVFPGSLGRISRELSYLSAAGGRPGHFAGERADRNAILYLPPR